MRGEHRPQVVIGVDIEARPLVGGAVRGDGRHGVIAQVAALAGGHDDPAFRVGRECGRDLLGDDESRIAPLG
ncbi:hypothetical protein ACQB6R_12270 [Propionibacteriaceae bacterium G1746]|uniref:hypothetical protein n=1 Tax=Aestuariimicrobium sp. G57 TaxID=3418485 RepID=UPI003C29B2D3